MQSTQCQLWKWHWSISVLKGKKETKSLKIRNNNNKKFIYLHLDSRFTRKLVKQILFQNKTEVWSWQLPSAQRFLPGREKANNSSTFTTSLWRECNIWQHKKEILLQLGFNALRLHGAPLISYYKAVAGKTSGIILGILYRNFGFSGCLKVHMAIKTFLKEAKEGNNFYKEEATKDFISF